MLSEALVRADLKELDYAQVFALQVLLSALVLSGLWGYVFTNAIDLLTRRVELNIFILFSLCVGSFVWFLPRIWLRRRYQFRLTAIERALPFFLDMVGLGLASGQTLQSALQMACDHLREGSLKVEWNHTLMDIRSGLSRAEALRQLSVRIDLIPLRQLISSLIQGEALGIGMAHIIEVYGKHQRAHRLMAAEKLALQAPIKMLFPLALFIFPCTFLVLGFPVAVQFLGLIP